MDSSYYREWQNDVVIVVENTSEMICIQCGVLVEN